MTGREGALKALTAIRHGSARSDEYLDRLMERNVIPEKDRPLAYRLCLGVLQNTALCDYYISLYLSHGLHKLQPVVHEILRLSVYQILFLSRIPASAAVNEGVKLAKKHANQGAAGLVNAVLRRIAENSGNMPDIQSNSVEEYLSVKYSHPVQFVRYLIAYIGEAQTRMFLEKNNEIAPIAVRVNTLLSLPEELENELRQAEHDFMPHPWMDGFFLLRDAGEIRKLDAFLQGKCTVQDPASALAVTAAGLKPGMKVLDICAAPGGKTFLASEHMQNSGTILACDLSDQKLKRIQEGAKRLGIRIIQCAQMDACVKNDALLEEFDAVLCDVPCSGMGVISKKPEIRYKSLHTIKELPILQLSILRNAADYLKPGGTLLYSTCTMIKEENEGVIQAFLNEREDFIPEAYTLPGPAGFIESGAVTLWPQIHGTDGFFICKIKKRTR